MEDYNVYQPAVFSVLYFNPNRQKLGKGYWYYDYYCSYV
jgi:hypothetical protein